MFVYCVSYGKWDATDFGVLRATQQQNIFTFNLHNKLANVFDYCKSKHDCKITFYFYNDFLLVCVYIYIHIFIYIQCYHLHYACKALNVTTCEFSDITELDALWDACENAQCKARNSDIHICINTQNIAIPFLKSGDFQGCGNRHWSNPEVSTAGYKGHMQSIYCQFVFRVKSVLQTTRVTDWCLLWFFLGYRRVTWLGESPGGRGVLHCLSSWGALGETASEIHPGWEWKTQGLSDDLGVSGGTTGKRRGEMHS